MSTDWRDKLFDERSLWDLYCQARAIGDTRINTVLRGLLIGLLISFIVANEILSPSLVPLESLRASIRAWCADGISFATSLLGFLVAGFTIFATLTKPAVFERLAVTKYKETDYTQLKFIFFNFMLVFIHYIAFLSYCLIINLFASKGGPLSVVLVKLILLAPWVERLMTYGAFLVTGTWFLWLVILLKSFVWNVYQSVLLAIAVETILDRKASGQ